MCAYAIVSDCGQWGSDRNSAHPSSVEEPAKQCGVVQLFAEHAFAAHGIRAIKSEAFNNHQDGIVGHFDI
jgi:hypothetical protein